MPFLQWEDFGVIFWKRSYINVLLCSLLDCDFVYFGIFIFFIFLNWNWQLNWNITRHGIILNCIFLSCFSISDAHSLAREKQRSSHKDGKRNSRKELRVISALFYFDVNLELKLYSTYNHVMVVKFFYGCSYIQNQLVFSDATCKIESRASDGQIEEFLWKCAAIFSNF